MFRRNMDKLSLTFLFFCLAFSACSTMNSAIQSTPNPITGGIDFSTGAQSIFETLATQPEAIKQAKEMSESHPEKPAVKAADVATNWSLEFTRTQDAKKSEVFSVLLSFHSELERIQNVAKTGGLQFSTDGKIYSLSTEESFLENKEQVPGFLRAASISHAKFTGIRRAQLEKIAASKTDVRVRINGSSNPINGFLHPETLVSLKNLLAAQ